VQGLGYPESRVSARDATPASGAVRQNLERELKLDAEPGFRLPRLPGWPLRPRTFLSRYFDTPDHRLAHHGITLRCRSEDRRPRWQVKLPRAGARLEVELPGAPTHVPTEFRRLLRVYTRETELVPIASLRTRRTGIRVRQRGRPVADVVLDSVAVLDGRRVKRRFHEVEIELIGAGDEQILERLGARLRASGASPSDGIPKVFRALGLDLAVDVKPPDPSTPPLDRVLAMLRAQLEAIRAHDPGTRLGEDPEELHQMRVATRRARAILRAARPMFAAKPIEALREELGWLGAALGGQRDLDVMWDHLRAEVRALDLHDRQAGRVLLRRLEAARRRARAELLTALDSPRYFTLLDRLADTIEGPPVVDPALSPVTIAGRAFKKLRKTVKGLAEAPTDDALHVVRIKAKRARYATELAVPDLGRPAERFVDRVKELQDLLGEHQDAVVAEARLRELAQETPGPRVGFVAGLLADRQRLRREAARAAFEETWREVQKRGRKAWR
jgi:CHAD domain-containing protein